MIGERGGKIYNGDIKIFGPRPSGKLTFLVALACFQNSSPNSPVLSIEENEGVNYLKEMGRYLLQMGMMLSPMDCAVSSYLSITLKPSFNILNPFNRQLIKLHACYTAYPGEIFELLLRPDRWLDCPETMTYTFSDLGTANQVILMFDSTSSQRDTEYAQAISVLRDELSKHINLSGNDKRYAIVFSKIDQAPGFFYLPDLNNFITIKFPRLFSEFQKWSKDGNCSIRYFACSAFGMYGNPPKPNAVGSNSLWVLKEPNAWQPFGLVAPIYWLLTGKDDSRLLDYPLFS
ncbi:MAG: hypothetical protein WCD53_03345 [Microcoleus sp.]